MKHLVPLSLFLLLLAAAEPASAATWNTYQNPKLRFAVKMPPGWVLAGSPQTGPVLLEHGNLAINVQVLSNLAPAPTLRQTVNQITRLQPAFSRVTWSKTTLGGRPAFVGIDSPPTEGGVTVSQAVYVTAWRRHVYQILLSSYHKPALRRLAQFPAIYRQILKTWRFL